jgi:hypothetical protein
MKYCSILLLVFVSQLAYSQTLVSYEQIGAWTTAEAEAELDITDAEFDQRFYKVIYLTPHLDGEVREASGFVSLPIADDRSFPTMIYQHGTAFSRDAVPSNDTEASYSKLMTSYGYITVAADYIGLGDSAGLHPYINADTESSAAADLLLASREIALLENVNRNDQLFITGYSQGGHASSALHRDIEAGRYADITTVTAGSHLSGPYSVSDLMVEFTLGDRTYTALSYLPFVVLSMKEAYPELLDAYPIEDIFLPNIVPLVEDFKNEEIDLLELNFALVGAIFATGSLALQPRLMVEPDFLEDILTDPDHPFIEALRINDTYDWVPQAPTRLMGCEGDDQVWYENAVFAEEVMLANGATDLERLELGVNFNHTDCIEPSFSETTEFFGQYQVVEFILDTDDVDSDCHPNVIQYTDRLEVRPNVDCNLDYIARLISSNGQEISTTTNIGEAINTENLGSGLFILQLVDENGGLYSHKFVK